MKMLLLLAATLFISGCAFTSGSKVSRNQSPQSAAPRVVTFENSRLTLVSDVSTTEPFVRETTSSLSYTLQVQNNKQVWSSPSTTVDLQYPVMAYQNNSANALAFNTTVTAKVETEKNTFLREVAENWPSSNFADEMSHSISVTTDVLFETDTLISLRFNVYTYFAGAAHPNVNTFSLNFDLQKGEELMLDNLFIVSSTEYLPVLSKQSINALLDPAARRLTNPEPTPLESDWVQQGAGPKAENFHTVNLSTDGLRITFDAYSVNAYAAGAYEVTLPASKLKNILSSEIISKLR